MILSANITRSLIKYEVMAMLLSPLTEHETRGRARFSVELIIVYSIESFCVVESLLNSRGSNSDRKKEPVLLCAITCYW